MSRSNWIAAGLLLLGTGCRPEHRTVPSHEIKTRDIWAEIDVAAESSESATVNVRLVHDDDTLDLSMEDQLVARHGVSSLIMARVFRQEPEPGDPWWDEGTFGESVFYTATFSDAEPDSSYEVGFLRASNGHGGSGASAPLSLVTLPAPFEIESPQEGDEVSVGHNVEVKWTDAGSDPDPVTVDIVGDCIEPGTFATAGSEGRLLIGPTSLARTDGTSQDCELTIVASRAREGLLDPHYGQSGFITARQVRTTHVTLTK